MGLIEGINNKSPDQPVHLNSLISVHPLGNISCSIKKMKHSTAGRHKLILQPWDVYEIQQLFLSRPSTCIRLQIAILKGLVGFGCQFNIDVYFHCGLDLLLSALDKSDNAVNISDFISLYQLIVLRRQKAMHGVQGLRVVQR